MSDIRQIAGANGVVLRDAERLAKMYDGEPSEWVKLGGISKTENFQYDIHWYTLVREERQTVRNKVQR